MALREPLDSPSAKKLIREILQSGEVSWSKHALDEMQKDALTTVDGSTSSVPVWSSRRTSNVGRGGIVCVHRA